ncbi:MAG: MerR family transcriptional regulator [Nitrospinae bacterium]|nr:MerR family transcriptional regulator [Nitrospinota bacterium]
MNKNSIPDKMFFKIGEVAKIADLEPHVLRYWESEFKELSPDKGDNGRRLYRKKDVAKVLQIKELLYKEKYSIKGAQRILRGTNLSQEEEENIVKKLDTVKRGLTEILNILD